MTTATRRVYADLRRQQQLARATLPRKWVTGGVGIAVDGRPFLTVRVAPGLQQIATHRLRRAGITGPFEVIEMTGSRAPNPEPVEPVPPYQYPALPRPIAEDQLMRELEGLLIRGGLVGDGGPRATVWLWDPLDAVHARDPRRYAQVIPDARRFEFARATLRLPPCHRLGLLAHEVGHVLAPDGGEDDADAAARDALGVPIVYDRRWPGKGLQLAAGCREA